MNPQHYCSCELVSACLTSLSERHGPCNTAAGEISVDFGEALKDVQRVLWLLKRFKGLKGPVALGPEYSPGHPW